MIQAKAAHALTAKGAKTPAEHGLSAMVGVATNATKMRFAIQVKAVHVQIA